MREIEWASERWRLHAEGALERRRDRTLVVADVHLGKDAAFRAAGVPVPAAAGAATHARLAAVVRRTRAERLVLLGDLLHARAGRTEAALGAFGAWRRSHAALDVVLVRGNHDERAGDPPPEWLVTCVDEPYVEGDVAFCHHPGAAPDDAPALAGHVHPCAVLRDVDGSCARLPCFTLGARRGLLPAFGVFTGTHRVRPRRGDRVFVIVAGEVVEVRCRTKGNGRST